MNRISRKRRALHVRLLLAVLLLGLACGAAACGGGSPESEEQGQATEEALAATEATAETDTAHEASIDTADAAGTWGRAGTMGGAADTAAAEGASTGEAVTYETYQNEKFGFSVRYPSDLMQPTEEVGNGNGQAFEAPDGSASMFVYATDEATAEQVQRRFEEQTTNPDLNVTYQTRGDGWYVLSGYRGDHIFYERVEARDNTLKVVRMFYDRSQKARYDPVVQAVSSSLQG